MFVSSLFTLTITFRSLWPTLLYLLQTGKEKLRISHLYTWTSSRYFSKIVHNELGTNCLPCSTLSTINKTKTKCIYSLLSVHALLWILNFYHQALQKWNDLENMTLCRSSCRSQRYMMVQLKPTGTVDSLLKSVRSYKTSCRKLNKLTRCAAVCMGMSLTNDFQNIKKKKKNCLKNICY